MRTVRSTGLVGLLIFMVLCPSIASARFMAVDRAAEKYPEISPYTYCDNNPVKFVDPSGLAFVKRTITCDVVPELPVGPFQSLEAEAAAMVELQKQVAKSSRPGYSIGFHTEGRKWAKMLPIVGMALAAEEGDNLGMALATASTVLTFVTAGSEKGVELVLEMALGSAESMGLGLLMTPENDNPAAIAAFTERYGEYAVFDSEMLAWGAWLTALEEVEMNEEMFQEDIENMELYRVTEYAQ